jgi:hypothetical protein
MQMQAVGGRQKRIRLLCLLPTAYCLLWDMKFGRIKRQHGRVGGLDAILDRIVKQCPHVTRIVPGRIKVRRGKTPPSFKIQYPTEAGLKCLYTGTGTVQEVFLICSDQEGAGQWLRDQGIAEACRKCVRHDDR